MRKAPAHHGVALAIAVLLVCGVVTWLAPARQAAGAEVPLAFRTGTTASRVFTPAKALHGGKRFSIKGAEGTISVAGQSVPFGAKWSAPANAFYVAMDRDGDGSLGRKEWVRLGKDFSASFQLKLDEATYAVRLVNLRILARTTGISSVSGACMVNGCRQGAHGTTMIRVFDDNLDGVYTQDGQDAIAVGRSGGAIPLRKVHQIGTQHCELEISQDGTQLTVTPLSKQEVGIVELPYKRGLACLAFTDEEGKSYDLAVSARTGIPPGSYKLSYGVLLGGGQMAVIRPTKSCPTYDIEAGKINKLRIGPPIRVSFSATYGQRRVRVSPRVEALGAGGELYSFDFSGGTGRPHVLLLEDKRLLQDIPMKYG